MKALFIVAPEAYQDKEYGDTRTELEKGNVNIEVASSKSGEAQGKFGGKVKIDKTADQVNVDDYDAIIFIGGPGAVNFQHDKEAHRIIKETQDKQKLLAAICIAPTILAYAGALRGKKATVWDDGNGTQAEILRNGGAQYLAEDVVTDGIIITANGPHAAMRFGQTILKNLIS